MSDYKIEWPSFICEGCERKAVQVYDEFVVNGEGRRLCPKCADKVLANERVFMGHVPGCVDAPHCLTFFSTWEDLERKLRRNPRMAGHRIGCSDVTERTAMLLEIFTSDKGVQWWVLGTAYNIPMEPPWPHWIKVVRELGGRL